MNKDNLFWGVIFILAAIYVLLRSAGVTPDVSLVRIVIGVLCLTGFVKAALQLEFGGMLFSLAVLAILFREYIGLGGISSWSLILAALFGTIGLNMLFGDQASAYRNRKKARKYGAQYDQNGGADGANAEFTQGQAASGRQSYTGQVDGEHIVLDGLFNGSKKNVQTENFKSAFVDCTFCGMEVNMAEVFIPSGTAVINLDVHFAGVTFYIPAEWQVVDQTNSTFGGFKEQHSTGVPQTGPTVIFQGKIAFGGVEVCRL